MTLRLRLAVWYGAFFALVLAVALFTTYAEHAGAHVADDDATLDGIWRNASDAARRTPPDTGSSETPLHEALDVLASDVSLFVVNRHGTVVASAHAPAHASLDSAAAAAPEGYSTGSVAGERFRLLAKPLQGRAGERLVAAMSLATLDASLARLRAYLLLTGIVAVIVAVGGGLVLSRSALRPVALVTETARSIAASGEFSRRVAGSRGDDEIGRLARTFDAMLDRLEAAYLRQQHFVADASHELRTPLAAMRTHVALLAAARDGDRDELLRRVEREVERLCDLVDDLLILSRADAGREPFTGQTVQLDEVLMDVFDGLRAREPARLAITALEEAAVTGERERLVQLVLILIDNALRYTPGDGHVTVSLSTSSAAAEVRVEDDGIGIDPTDAPRLFDRFYRGAGARRMDPAGSGLGLAIARWIVDRHDGKITVEPREPTGTRAVVRLPLAVVARRATPSRAP